MLFVEPCGTDPVGGKIRRNISMARQFQMVSSKSLVRMPTSDSIEFQAHEVEILPDFKKIILILTITAFFVS